MDSSENTITRIKKKSESDLDPRCCQTGCPDCPYGFQEQFDPDIPIELQKEIPPRISPMTLKNISILIITKNLTTKQLFLFSSFE